MAIDGNPATGWGIHPAVGASHHVVFELVQPLTLKAGAKLTISLKQLSGKSHLIGLFKLFATDDPAARATVMPALAQEALKLPADNRSEVQRITLAAHALRQIAIDEIAKFPPAEVVRQAKEPTWSSRRGQRHAHHFRESEDRAVAETRRVRQTDEGDCERCFERDSCLACPLHRSP